MKPTVAEVSAFCMKCKEKRSIEDAVEKTLKNGRKAMMGTCHRCGTTVYRFMSSDQIWSKRKPTKEELRQTERFATSTIKRHGKALEELAKR